MRSHTPRATPVVRAPSSSAPPLDAEARRKPGLHPPVSIITPAGDHELEKGALIIGRLPECDLLLEDALVSRMHARIYVNGEAVIVEDLHSTNGVYVNGVRITHSAVLREGDRLLTGTTEISVFEARRTVRSSAAPSRPPPRPSQPPQLRVPRASQPETHAPAAVARRPVPTTLPAERAPESDPMLRSLLEQDEPSSETRLSTPPTLPSSSLPPPASNRAEAPSSSAPSTARADAIEVIGALAERLAAGGNIQEASRVLAAHLGRILQGASAGLHVPDEVCTLAARQAVLLASWTRQSAWLDYVIELHLAARRCLSPLTFTAFEGMHRTLGGSDARLLSYYVDSLSDGRTPLSGDERLVLERLLRLTS
jgi:hypothetical protein